MPRRLPVEYPGGIYHVMNHADRLRDICLGERQRREHPKIDPAKLPLMAARLRQETILTIRQLAQRQK
jgi:hypothetical protein